jgi:hypothetical protein
MFSLKMIDYLVPKIVSKGDLEALRIDTSRFPH